MGDYKTVVGLVLGPWECTGIEVWPEENKFSVMMRGDKDAGAEYARQQFNSPLEQAKEIPEEKREYLYMIADCSDAPWVVVGLAFAVAYAHKEARKLVPQPHGDNCSCPDCIGFSPNCRYTMAPVEDKPRVAFEGEVVSVGVEGANVNIVARQGPDTWADTLVCGVVGAVHVGDSIRVIDDGHGETLQIVPAGERKPWLPTAPGENFEPMDMVGLDAEGKAINLSQRERVKNPNYNFELTPPQPIGVGAIIKAYEKRIAESLFRPKALLGLPGSKVTTAPGVQEGDIVTITGTQGYDGVHRIGMGDRELTLEEIDDMKAENKAHRQLRKGPPPGREAIAGPWATAPDVCRYAKPAPIRWPDNGCIKGAVVKVVIPPERLPQVTADMNLELDGIARAETLTQAEMEAYRILTELRDKARARIARLLEWPFCGHTQRNLSIVWIGDVAHWQCLECAG